LDFIGRFENIKEDWEFISKNINFSGCLPFENRGKHLNYKKYYSEKTKKIIETLYKKDIELYSYNF
jgi:hypothetical protein